MGTGKTNHYRICFCNKNGIMKTSGYKDTCFEKAKCFVVYKNSKFLGEFLDIENAINMIFQHEGKIGEIAYLLKNKDRLKSQKESFYYSVGLVYTKKIGLRIEHKLK